MNEDLLTEEELSAFRLGADISLALRGKLDASIHDAAIVSFHHDESLYVVQKENVSIGKLKDWTLVINQHEGSVLTVPMQAGESVIASQWVVLRVVSKRRSAKDAASLLMQHRAVPSGLRVVLISSKKEEALQPGDIVTVTQF